MLNQSGRVCQSLFLTLAFVALFQVLKILGLVVDFIEATEPVRLITEGDDIILTVQANEREVYVGGGSFQKGRGDDAGMLLLVG